MKNTTLKISDSLLGSLCREIYYVKQRYQSLNQSLTNTSNESLKLIYTQEVNKLEARKSELREIASGFSHKEKGTTLSRELFIELCKRSIIN